MTNPEDYLKLSPRLRMDLVVCLLLGLVAFAIYSQVRNYSFVNYDDVLYITQNPHVQKGLNLESLTWSFTTGYFANWHPLTWISYLIDIQIFGLNPGALHLTNVFFHIANAQILFLVLRIMTGKSWQSALVAALFALHPLHVESVAWISERKDVLSTFFWLLTMLSYAWYVKQPYYHEKAGIFRYLVVILCFLLGLMSKSMLVTLPFVLLLLDYWPLKRFQLKQSNGISKNQKKAIILALLWEKVPLFILLITMSIVTYMVQQQWNTIATINDLSLFARFSNALVSYVIYLFKMIWPFNLAVFYPHPGQVLGLNFWGALLTLTGISLLAIKTARQAPFFIVGWLWYLGTLVPVIGMVQVGEQALADRYTYVPLIGAFIIIAWGVPILWSNRRYKKLMMGLLGIAALSFFTTITWFQLPIWANSITLFENAVKVNPDSAAAQNNLGNALEESGNLAGAIVHYSEALRIKPDTALFHRNLARTLYAQEKIEQAIEHYSRALHIYPDSANSHNALGLILSKQGNFAEAIYHYSESIRIEPLYAVAHNNMGLALIKIGEIEKAVVHLREALRINPDFSDANINLKKALSLRGNIN